MTPLKSKAVYKFTYKQNGFIQFKHLITQVDYVIYKEMQKLIGEYEFTANKKNGQNKSEITAIKKDVKKLFGEQFFVEQTPLFEAIETGYIDLLPQQGGRHYLTIEKWNT